MARLRSPLRFPGGKSLAVKIIAPMVPPEHKVIVSPFMGGGSLELHWAQNGRRVIAYDGFYPVVAFWQNLLDVNCRWDLVANIQTFFPLSREEFYQIQRKYSSVQKKQAHESFLAAAGFFVLNRSSFSGTTMSGGCSEPSKGKNARFTQSSIDRLRKFDEIDWKDKLTVNYSLWPDTLAAHPDLFAYLDPPYAIGPKIYGVRGDMHKGFDHQGLAAALRARTAPWLLSYNDCEEIRELYEGFDIQPIEWSNSMGKKKRQQELIIKNY